MSFKFSKLFISFKKKNEDILLPLFVALLVVVIALLALWQSSIYNQRLKLSETNKSLSGAKMNSYQASNEPSLQKDDKLIGSSSAPLKVFVYEDYTNPFSAQLANTLAKIKAELSNKLVLVIRPFVLANSPSASQSVLALDCAANQGKWQAMRELLFKRALQKEFIQSDFSKEINELGLDSSKFKTCLAQENKSDRIENIIRQAKAYSVQGAPTIFIGSQMIIGARPYADFIDSNGDKIIGLKTVIKDKLSSI